jgi:hypothetical protein
MTEPTYSQPRYDRIEKEVENSMETLQPVVIWSGIILVLYVLSAFLPRKTSKQSGPRQWAASPIG